MQESRHGHHDAASSERLAPLAHEAIKTFREENPDAYRNSFTPNKASPPTSCSSGTASSTLASRMAK